MLILVFLCIATDKNRCSWLAVALQLLEVIWFILQLSCQAISLWLSVSEWLAYLSCITLGHFNFWLSLSLSKPLSETLSWTLKSALRPKFNLTLELDFRWSESQKGKWLKLSLPCKFDRLKSVRLNFALSMYRDRNLGPRLSLCEITLLLDLSLYLDRTLAQRKAKSKVKVTHWLLSQKAKFHVSQWKQFATELTTFDSAICWRWNF